MELDKIKAKIAKLSKEKNVEVQVLWDTFFFQELIARLSISDYKNHFVLKGGFYLQSVVGVETRNTMDIDLKIIGKSLSDDELYCIINDIINMRGNEMINFEIKSINNIKAETKYGGKTVKLYASFYNIKKVFSLDIGVGDIVTPNPMKYGFTSLFYEDKEFDVLAYPIETCMAEKLETIIAKGINNSRSKDLLDLYLYESQNYDCDTFVFATINTFAFRGSIYDKERILNTIEDVFSNRRIYELYLNYQSKRSFAKDITFEMCKESVYRLVSKLIFRDKLVLSEYDIEMDLIRHGQDEEDKLGGWSDNHLTSEGISQITSLARTIDGNYDLLISSDLNRAKESAEIISKELQMDIVFNQNLREINNGDLRNLTKTQFDESYPNLFFSSLGMDESYPNGESPTSFYNRVYSEFLRIINENKGKKILIVTHGGVITILLSLVNGYPYSNKLKIAPSVGAIVKLR